MNEIRENRIGAVVFALLGIGGLVGICAGIYIHLFTFAAGGIMSWALWQEARKAEQKLNNHTTPMLKTGIQVLNSAMQEAATPDTVTLDTAKQALHAERKVAQTDRLDRHRRDLQFIEEMISSFDNRDGAVVRRMMIDWRDELEENIAELKRELR